MTTMTKLTSRENLQADVITELAKEGQLGLMRVKYQGRDEAVLITVTDNPRDPEQVHITPLAILLDERMFEQMIPYEGPGVGECLGVSSGDLVAEHPALRGLRDHTAGGFPEDDWNPFGNRSAV